MNYIDRTRIGIEQFLAQLSPLTSPLNKHTPEETVELLQQDTYSAQTDECRRIQGGLRRLISARYALKDTIPARVRMVAESQFTPTPERLLPVFRWVQTLRRDNEQARIRWLYALKDVSSALGGAEGDFLKSFSEIAAQRVTLLPGGNTLTLSVPDSLWGQISLRFCSVPAEDLPDVPVFGYLFWVEADRDGDAYTFHFAVDLEFSDTIYQERLLQSKNWKEIVIHCSGAEMTVHQHDYTARVASYGYSGLDAMMICLGELIRKQAMLGVNALNGEETRLLGTAMVFARLELIPNPVIGNAQLPPMSQLMDNRYQLMQTAGFLERECGNPGIALSRWLREASDAYENDDPVTCAKKLDKFKETLGYAKQDGTVRSLTHPVLEMLRSATAAYAEPYPFEAYFQDARQHIEAALAEFLRQNGFGGAFPHYYRRRGNRAEYLSFVTDGIPVTTNDGTVLLRYAIEIARCRVRIKEEKATAFGFAWTQLCASEFEADEMPGCRFGRVCSPKQDGGVCAFGYRFEQQPGDEEARRDAAEYLLEQAKIALCGLEGRRLARGYRPHDAGQLRAEHAFTGLFGRDLMIGLPVAIAVILLLRDQLRGQLRSVAVTVAALLAGLVAVFAVTAVRYVRLRRSIWNR